MASTVFQHHLCIPVTVGGETVYRGGGDHVGF